MLWHHELILRPTAALTTFSPHVTQTPAGTSSTTTSLPLIQNSCLMRFSSTRPPQTWQSP